MIMVRLLSTRAFMVGLAPPSLLGSGSRHCYGINYAHNASRLTNALPFRSERKGITPMAAFEGMIPLLLVVHCGALVFLALCIGSIGCDRAALAIGRDHNVGCKNNLPAFF